MKTIPFYALLLLGLLFGNCRLPDDADKNADNLSVDKIIDRPGKYVSPDLNTILNIEVRDNIVVYSMSDTAGRVLYNSTPPNAGTFQNWFFAMDKYGAIWFNSSDIGLFKMKRFPDRFERITCKLDNKDSLAMPESVYEHLPSSLKK